MRIFRVGLVLGAAVAVALGCAGDGMTDPDNGNGNGGGNGGGGGGSGFAAAVQPIFTANCALSGCHAGANPAQGMNLSQGQAYSNIVNVMANQTSGTTMLMRVLPSDPGNSYLVHKIEGTQGTVGGAGAQMPLGGAPLTQAQINTIRQWITDGAQNN